MEDRRKQGRMSADYDVFIQCGGRTGMVRSKDITMQGIRVFSREPLKEGESVALNFMIPEQNMNISLKGKVVYCRGNPDESRSEYPYFAGIEFLEEFNEGLIPAEKEGSMVSSGVSRTVSINAPAEKCYRMACDFSLYPRWSGVLDKVTVLETYPDGRGRKVSFQASILFTKLSYTLEYSYDDENLCLSWKSAGGDLVSTRGKYSFKPIAENRSSSTYEIDVTVNFFVPNKVITFLSNITLPRVMKGFKKLVEQSE